MQHDILSIPDYTCIDFSTLRYASHISAVLMLKVSFIFRQKVTQKRRRALHLREVTM